MVVSRLLLAHTHTHTHTRSVPQKTTQGSLYAATNSGSDGLLKCRSLSFFISSSCVKGLFGR